MPAAATSWPTGERSLRRVCIETTSAISGVEPSHEGFETRRYACDQTNVERGLRQYVEVGQGVRRIG